MASILDLEAGFSGRSAGCPSASPMGARKASFRSIPTKGSSPSPAPWCAERGDGRYFLASCCLCGEHLNGSSDIFMYRGDMAFCSEECREEQMEMDEATERKQRNLPMKTRPSSTPTVAANQRVVHGRTAETAVAG